MTQSQTKNCQNCQTDFLIEPEDFDFYKKISVPPPTFCYLCRAQRRFVYRNERGLFKRKSSFSGKEIFSSYREDVPFPVYTPEEWNSDDWDPMKYGRDYDFNRTFFEQFKELSDIVPKRSKIGIRNINSPYSNNAGELKNCYLMFNSDHSEDCSYGTGVSKSRLCIDNSYLGSTELSYDNVLLGSCYRTLYSFRSSECTDVYFSKNLTGCNNCFGCVNLKGKSYYIFNKPYSKEDYEEKLKEFNLGSYSAIQKLKKEVEEFWSKFPDKFNSSNKNVDVIGEYIYNSKNTKYGYLNIGVEDSKYCQNLTVPSTKDSYDYSVAGFGAELCYEVMVSVDGVYNLKFCLYCFPNAKNFEYCEYCSSSSDLFGCVGLKNKQYCILNKQYTKAEYKDLVEKIKKQMMEKPYFDKCGRVYRYGEFFPAEFSPFGYNETIAQEQFPLTREQVEKNGYVWREVETKEYKITILAKSLEDDIVNIDKDILKEIIGCAHEKSCNDGCTGAFRLTPQEFKFYKNLNIPIPRLCPTCRHRVRLVKRNGIRLYNRSCMCAGEKDDTGVYVNIDSNHKSHKSDAHCPNNFKTAYKKGGKEIIYCESCLQAEVA